jgi:patatin-related protein
MAAIPTPSLEYTKEVRFAVVMYGGVSLAIYINGIAQEFLSLVRSTAGAYEGGAGRQALSGVPIQADDDENTKAQKLRGTERIYRKLSYLLSDQELLKRYKTWLKEHNPRPGTAKPDLLDDYLVNGKGDQPEPITTGFIVDILSGTSAGGINAIFLAKALANDQAIDKLKQLWIKEGDIAVLINDKKSLAGLNLDNQNPPKSLLNSRRMYLELLKAFDGMDRVRESQPGQPSPYVNELDLFVTTTDIKGAVLPLQLSDKIVYEKRHRNVFHFKYGTHQEFGQDCNHFLRKYNPFLAFAARCTSSFPFAFEPMRLCELDGLLQAFGDKDHNYAATSGARSELWKPFFKENVDVAVDNSTDFLTAVGKRSYGDGGYLDNKPFSYATETLARRQSTVPIERKLVYIEPSPEHPEDERQDDTPPNVIANAKAALLDLPTYETIRQDLQRVLQRNRTFQRLNRMVQSTNEDLDKTGRRHERYKFKSDKWRLMDMSMMVKYCGIYFLPYRRLRIASVTDDLALLVARIKNLDERSDFFVAVRGLLRAWRNDQYVENYNEKDAELVNRILESESDTPPLNAQPTEETFNAFLDDFDFTYRFRRLTFVLSKIDELLRSAEHEQLRSAQDKLGIKGEDPTDKSNELSKLSSRYSEAVANVLDRAGVKNTLVFLAYLKGELLEVHKTLRTMARQVRAASGASKRAADKSKPPLNRLVDSDLDEKIAQFYEQFAELKLDERQLKYILGIPGDLSDKGDIRLTAKGGEEFANLDPKVCEERAERLYESDATLNKLLKQIGRKLNLILGAKIILPTSNYCAQLLNEKRPLPEALSKAAPDISQIPASSRNAIREYVREFYIHFDDYDQVRFPILYQTEFGESAEVDIFRISPEDAPNLINERGPGSDGRKKLAGNALFHFGAFLDRVWRENDIMWGRLDGAERLITALMPDPDHQLVRDKLISDAHLAILHEEMPPETQLQLSGLLSEALIRASSGEPFQEAVEKVMGPLKSPKIKQRLATAMRACLEDEKLLNFVKDHYEVNRDLEPKPLLRSMARATQVTGRIFDDVAQAHQVDSKSIRWIARAGQIFWGLVEVAVPGSVANLFFYHGLKLIYVFEFLLILFGTLLANRSAQQLGWLALAITVAVHTAQLVLSDTMRGKRWWRYLVIGPGALFILLIVGFGIATVIGIFYEPEAWKKVEWVQEWVGGLNAPGRDVLKIGVLVCAGVFVLSAFWGTISARIRTRLAGLLPLLLGLAITAGMIYAFATTAARNQVLPGGLHVPGLAIEMASQPQDVLTIERFVSPTGTDAVAGATRLRTGVTVDFGFIGLYTVVFLMFSWWLARRRFAAAAGVAIVAALLSIATAGFDILENVRLYAVLDSIMPDASMLSKLRFATVLKWIFCFGTTGVLSVLFLSRRDRGYLLGLALLLVSIVGVLGLFYNPLLEAAFLGLGLVVFLIGLFIVVMPDRFRSISAPGPP